MTRPTLARSFTLVNPPESRYFPSRIDHGELSFETDEMNLTFGYNTNGFAHHKLEDALEIIADCGYRGVALTLDNYHCNPFTYEPADLNRLRQLLDKLQLRVVIETGARYLLNPQRKHYPALVS